jgi:4-hydroxybenzoate polyprenyltransferase
MGRALLPPPGCVQRLGVYAAEMFPLPQRAASALVLAGGACGLVARGSGLPAPRPTELLLPALSAFALMLALRLMDEFKDRDVDRALFGFRPLPSGRVLEADLRLALLAALGLFVLPPLLTGRALGSGLLVLGYALLMFRFFFAPDRLRASLPLTLATHTPVVLLLLLHVTDLFASGRGLPLHGLQPAPLLGALLGLWCGVLAWELSRKVRAPEQEDAYVTYSRLLGTRRALLLVVAVQALGSLAVLAVLHGSTASVLARGVVLAGWLGALLAQARFLRDPARGQRSLAPAGELHALGLALGGLLP